MKDNDSYEQTSSVIVLGTSFSLSKPYGTVIPSWIVYRCPYLWARPPVLSDGELPSFLVSAPFSCNLDPSPVGAGKPEAWCLPASSMTLFKLFPLLCLLPNLNCPNSHSLPRSSLTGFPPHEAFSNLSPLTNEKAFLPSLYFSSNLHLLGDA